MRCIQSAIGICAPVNVLILSLLLCFTPQNDVKLPKSTRHSCPVTWSLIGGQNEIKTVELLIETTPAKAECNPKDKNSFSQSSFAYLNMDQMMWSMCT